MLADAPARAKCNDRWRVTHDPSPRRASWEGFELAVRSMPSRGPMLLHFTRASDGPWPDESPAQYYGALADGAHGDPRDGFATLQRIVHEQRIRGSRFRMRGGRATVSLTALDPADAVRLVRWRARFARYAFEPYAVGVSMHAAVRLGAREVIYDEGAARSGAGDDGSIRQGRGPQGVWEAEREWRVEGDLDLSMPAPREIVVWTATSREADQLRAWCPYAVESFS